MFHAMLITPGMIYKTAYDTMGMPVDNYGFQRETFLPTRWWTITP